MKPAQAKISSPTKSLPRREQPVIAFAKPANFSKWLVKHHASHQGIWMRIYKKASGHPTVTYTEALDVALCHGWIDGQKQRGDEESWLQKFTRRGPRSVWSKVNVGNIERLTREGRMKPAGIAAVDAAKADGRWENAYHSSSTAEVPADFLQALAKSRKAEAFFKTLNKANRYSFLFRIHNAKKPETRTKRIKDFVAMLARGEQFHPPLASKTIPQKSK
ncbi:MAG: YdeI/OmpD-associated family protein [Chthoniobacteraceae bacterium]